MSGPAPGPSSSTGPGPADSDEGKPLLLASASPRRSEILHALGIPHSVAPVEIDESPSPGEEAAAYVERLARGKVAAAAGSHPGRWVLAGDTVVVLEGELLGKPGDREEAVAMLLRLEGRAHEVASGLAVAVPEGGPVSGRPDPSGREAPRIVSGVAVTEVRFRPFDEATARAYVATGEPMDKAGAYGIQGLGSVLVEGVTGDYSAVVGLPVALLLRLLEEAGRPYRFPVGGMGHPPSSIPGR